MSDFTYELPSKVDYFKALKDYLKHNRKDNLIQLLEKCTISFEETSTFTEKIWNTYWCSIIFSIPINELDNVNSTIESDLKTYCQDVLPADCGYLVKNVKFVPQIVSSVTDEISVEVAFENQKKLIMEEIRKAKFSIWIAVAWFTLDEIYDLLVEKKKEGVNVRIIVSDDSNNQIKKDKYKNDLNILLYPKFGSYNTNMMHHKFCIIDSHTVLDGSFNWSKNAEYNKENIKILNGQKTVSDFGKEFLELYNEMK